MKNGIVKARGITLEECMDKVEMFSKMGYKLITEVEEKPVKFTRSRFLFSEQCRSRIQPTTEFSAEMQMEG